MRKRQKTSRQTAGRHTENRQKLILNGKSAFAVTEAYRALRTNIMYSLPGGGCKCIAVTSASRGEGKTTNTVNLALAFAQAGKHVLLIDADMRIPAVALTLKSQGNPGLSDLLTGGARFSEAAYRLPKYGLDILPAGNIPPDPTFLLGSAEMKQLLGQLKEHYDYIFIDLPPVNVVTDAMLIAESVDGYLLLVKHYSTGHRQIVQMLARCRSVGARILGFLYVNTPPGGGGYYKKFYGL